MASLGVPGLRTNRSIQTEKGRVLLDSTGFLSKGHTGKGAGRQQRLSITRAAEEVLSGTYTHCHIGHAFAWGGEGQFKALISHLAKQYDCEAETASCQRLTHMRQLQRSKDVKCSQV